MHVCTNDIIHTWFKRVLFCALPWAMHATDWATFQAVPYIFEFLGYGRPSHEALGRERTR